MNAFPPNAGVVDPGPQYFPADPVGQALAEGRGMRLGGHIVARQAKELLESQGAQHAREMEVERAQTERLQGALEAEQLNNAILAAENADLQRRLQQAKAGGITLQESEAKLRATVAELQQAKQRLEEQLAEADRDQKLAQSANDRLLRHHNRVVILLESALAGLEELVRDRSSLARRIGALIASAYRDRVPRELAQHTIRVAPHEDADLAKALPRVFRWLRNVLAPPA